MTQNFSSKFLFRTDVISSYRGFLFISMKSSEFFCCFVTEHITIAIVITTAMRIKSRGPNTELMMIARINR